MLYEMLQMESKNIVEVNKTLQSVKDNSWVGHLSNSTEDLDYIISKLKDLIEYGDLKPKDELEAIKQLAQLERDKINQAKHLDMVMLKTMEIKSGVKTKDIEVKDEVALWQK